MNRLRLTLIAFFLLLAVSFTETASAQCSMCRRVAETNLDDGNKRGRGLNNGILYMMSVPYLLGGAGVFIWWRYRQAGKSQEPEN